MVKFEECRKFAGCNDDVYFRWFRDDSTSLFVQWGHSRTEPGGSMADRSSLPKAYSWLAASHEAFFFEQTSGSFR